MKHKGLLIVSAVTILIIGGSFLFGLIVYLAVGGGASSSALSMGRGVGLVTVDGAIVSADKTVEDLKRFRDDDGIRSVVLRIESPGGSVAASQEILEAVRSLVEKKPVVASMGSVAASGGYYIACGATRILANPGTLTGSIGVRMEHVMLGDLLRWAKIQHETLKSGRLKDIASMDRPMTPEERRIIEDMLLDIHKQFKEEVAKSRSLPMEKVDEIADGRAYTGRQALDLGLVDELGGFSEAVKLAGKLGRVSGEPKLIRPSKGHSLFERIFDAAGEAMSYIAVSAAINHWQPMLLMFGSQGAVAR